MSERALRPTVYRTLFCCLLCLLLTCTGRAAGITNYQPLNTAGFWQKIFPAGAAVTLDKDRLRALGQGADLAGQPERMTGRAIERLLRQNLPLLDRALTVKGRPLSADYKRLLTAELDIPALAAANGIEPGVTVTRANLRALPTNDSLTTADGVDQLQIAAVDPSEAVLILWQSKNKAFYFVRSRHYSGWLPVWTVARTQRDIWLSYVQTDDFLLVTADRLPLMAGREEKLYQMGARIPLQEVSGNTYTVFLPERDKQGYLVERAVILSPSDNYRRGFLPYTRHNILQQAFRMLGAPYGRDNMPGRVDSAVFIANIYRTVGLELPRNSAALEQSAATRLILQELDGEAKNAMLDAAQPGDVLCLPGQALLYVGKTQNVYYVIHALDKHYANGGAVSVKRVVVSDLALAGVAGQTYYDALTSALSYR